MSADELMRQGAHAQASGQLELAESLMRQALELAESEDGGFEGELPLLLNELARLYLKQSNFAAAEPLLVRLLAMKRELLGDEHPEVATVLASLASVRKSLGDYGSAEELYRHALQIRELTLPPNHITSAMTMESLAETCAARGHYDEALRLSRRALEMREVTLGPRDASVRSARERIADLQLQAPEENGASRPFRSTPGSHPAYPDIERARIVGASRLPMVLVPYAAELTEIEREIVEPAALTTPARISAVVAGELQSPAMVRTLATVAALIVAAIAVVTFQVRKRPSAAVFAIAEPDRARPQADSLTTLPAPTPAAAEAASPAGAVKRAAIGAGQVPVAAPIAFRQQAVVAPERSAPALRLPRGIAPSINVPEIGVANAAALPVTTFTDTFVTTLTPGLNRDNGARASDTDRAPAAPRLVGAAPQPRYPDRLRGLRVEGEVMIQFTVNENGRADMSSMQVVRSPHPLLTDAVRGVLPQFRFEPARTAAPDSRPRAETVKYAFTFNVPR